MQKRYSIYLPNEGLYAFTGNGPSTGGIVGIVIGVLVTVVVVVAAIGYRIFKFVNKRYKPNNTDDGNTQ